jgi:hypothetical protein
MKQMCLFVRGILAACFVLAFVTATSAATQDGIVKVVNLKGAARYMPAGGSDWKPLKTGMLLKPGAIIQTAADSYVDVVLNNAKATQGLNSALSAEPASYNPNEPSGNYRPKAVQDAVRIFENTVLSVDKLTINKTGADTVTETQLDLKAGRIFGTVKKLSASSVYEVKIPNGVAGIRGTIYLISADGTVSVLTGEVVVSYVSNGVVTTKDVPAGYQFDPSTGQVTPISNPLLRELIRLAQMFSHYMPTFVEITLPNDKTIYRVSPIESHGGNPGNGGGDTPASR